MPDVKPWLTTANRKELSQLLGKVNLHLLYKARVHGFRADVFHAKCDKQGPTLTVGYNKAGYVFGGYTSKDFDTSGFDVKDNKAFLFRLSDEKAEGTPKKLAINQGAEAICNHISCGPNFGGILQFLVKGKAVVLQLKFPQSYNLYERDLSGCDIDPVECEVYRVEELGAPWRNVTWTTKRQELLGIVRSYRPYGNSASKVRVLLIGPVGGGKSSFINSVNSNFRGHVTNRALIGSGLTSTTTMYSTYTFRGGKCGISAPLILCDTMGLAEDTESGIRTDDLISIIKGHVPNKYRFNPTSPIHADTNSCIKSATVAERIHCVAYVIDASKLTMLSPEMKKKIHAIQSQINQLEIPQIVLLTKVDKECPLVANDLEMVYHSDLIVNKVTEIGQQLGIPISYIIPVKNYWSDHELDNATDILILSALVQILRYADDYFENLDAAC
ncbi:interferon-induced protein 44-like isoform X2 [Carcharodon carcharias]|uniref:interferon-induced protein 44-like isoform X2 n=1 Tax=Carcharodon carcharias TaxID=13397 RepID=UPI001B7D9F3B|nr:interferon-induced protein 44-like isoform X2 [Carcharodon carcharias]